MSAPTPQRGGRSGGRQQLHGRAGRWRWTLVLDGGNAAHGWAETEADGWAQVREALNRPHRGTRYMDPRGLRSVPPA